jgi:8-oxo-dGTP diphosphatase
MSQKSERHKVIPAVFVVMHHNGEVLFHRRANTGFRDGDYDVPSGHVDENEKPNDAAARELFEEALVECDPDDLELFHVITNETESPGKPYLYMFFRIARKSCRGVPMIGEPNKCDEMRMFPISALPENITPHVRTALENFGSKIVTFSQTVIE